MKKFLLSLATAFSFVLFLGSCTNEEDINNNGYSDKEKAKKEMEEIAESAKIKYGVYQINLVHFVGEFYTGDPLFLVAVLGPHRTETLDALKEVIERVKFDIDFKKEEISNEGTKIILAGG